MTQEQLSYVAGIVLSLLLEYLPFVREWYEKYSASGKRAILIGILAVSAAGAFGLSCYSPSQYFECSTAGAWEAVQVFVQAAIATQAAYLLTKRSKEGD